MGKSFHSFFGTRHSYWKKYITCFQKTVKNSKSNQVPFEVCFEISKQTAKGALKFQSKLQRELWSFKANFKGNFVVSKQTSKWACAFIETSSYPWSLLWNFKPTFVVCIETAKPPLQFALKFQIKLQGYFELCFEISKQTSKGTWFLLPCFNGFWKHFSFFRKKTGFLQRYTEKNNSMPKHKVASKQLAVLQG